MKKFLGKIWKSPRGRILIFIIVIIVAFIVGANLLIDKTKEPLMPSKSANIDINPNQMVKVQAQDQQYQSLAEKHQQDTRTNAQKKGESYMANIFAFSDKDKNDTKKSSVASNDQSQKDKQTKTGATSEDDKSMDPKSFYENQEKQKQNTKVTQYRADGYTGYVNPQEQGQYEKIMSSSMNSLIASWSKGYQAQTVQAIIPASSGQSQGLGRGQGPVMIKAGSILFAVIDTAVNSDQAGTPVLATIVTGPYRGTKLLGSFTRQEDRLVIQFSLMSMPSMSKSISISAYAINSKTAQTALASNVDNHYLTRWGGLLGSAFLQGFGTYFSSSNSSQYCGDSNSSTSNCYVFGPQQLKASFQDGVYSGVGQVGTALSDAMAKNFDRPPTVTLNQGTGVGILFMADVTATGSADTQVKGLRGLGDTVSQAENAVTHYAPAAAAVTSGISGQSNQNYNNN